jgi:hypothetical protein
MPLRFSQALAWLCLGLAALVLTAPFRGGDTGALRPASAMPLMALGTLAERGSFHRLHEEERLTSSSGSLFRLGPLLGGWMEGRREILVRKPAAGLPAGLDAPRTGWERLDKSTRAMLDAACGPAVDFGLLLRASTTLRGDAAELTRVRQRLGAGPAGAAVELVIGNGRGLGDGVVQVIEPPPGAIPAGPVLVTLVGDFHQRPATQAQWEALDEVMDFLTIKWGGPRLRLADSREEGGGPGPYFPGDQLLREAAGQ